MRYVTRLMGFALIVLTYGIAGYAEEGVLVVQVANPMGEAVVGVRLSATGDSSTSPPSDVAGKTRIRLAPQTKPGDEVEVVIVQAPQGMVFISPWNSRITVPCFENNTRCAAKVVLAERGGRMLLEYPAAQTAMAATVNAANAKASGERLTEEQRQMNLAEVAQAYGFKPEEVDRAIRALGEKTTDAYQLGLVALYEKNYSEATRQLTLSVGEREQKFEKAKSELADAQFFLGRSLYEQGKYKESASAFQRVAELRPDDATTLNDLGVALVAAGEYARAGGYHQRSLKLFEKQFGAEHPLVARSLSSLAVLYFNQGKYGEAEPLLKRSLAIVEKQLGAEHPDVAMSLNNLAELFREQGKYQEAEPLHRRALAIHEKQLGAEHPSVATGLNNLALLYSEQGKYQEAEPLFKRALAIYEKRLGAEHPSVATGLTNVAVLYFDQGKYGEAEPLYKRALAIYEKRLGTGHPNIAVVLENYARLLRKMNRTAEAEVMDARAEKIKAEHTRAHPKN